MAKRNVSTAALNILLVIACSASAFAQQAATAIANSKLLELTVPAPSLKGNMLGDPVEQKIFVYLPPGYDASSTKRYPTLYLLHGFLADSTAFINGDYQGMKLQTLMDESIKNAKVREMIVVAANGSNAYRGSFYTNSQVTGNWEDFIFRDLVNYIDTNYRTLPRAESRGIAGHSMGGYGAVMLGMKHPDIFGALYALSPCCLVMENDFGATNSAWSKVIQLTAKDQLKEKFESFEDFYKIAFIAVSAAFSPNPAHAPFYVDFPFKAKAGTCGSGAQNGSKANTSCVEKNEEIFLKWRAKMPVYIAEENKQNLTKLRGIFLDYGQKEEFAHIRMGVQLFSKALSELNIPHEFEVYADGNHVDHIRQRMETRVLEFFNEKLVFEK